MQQRGRPIPGLGKAITIILRRLARELDRRPVGGLWAPPDRALIRTRGS